MGKRKVHSMNPILLVIFLPFAVRTATVWVKRELRIGYVVSEKVPEFGPPKAGPTRSGIE